MTFDLRTGARLSLAALLGSTLLLTSFTAHADPSPPVTVHPDGQTPAKAASDKPVDPQARLVADHEAFLSARLAALHAGLSLTADQEALWPPVEGAIRDLSKTGRRVWRHHREDAGEMSSTDRLKRRGDHLVQRGEAIRKLADATAPMLASLSPEQRGRLPVLLHGVRARSIIARAFELHPDDFGGDGQKPDRRGMRGDRDDRRGERHAFRDRDETGDRQGMGDERDEMEPRHHQRDSDGLDDIAFRN